MMDKMRKCRLWSVNRKCSVFLAIFSSFLASFAETVVFRVVDSETGNPVDAVLGRVYGENEQLVCEVTGDTDGYIRVENLKRGSAYRFELSATDSRQYILQISPLEGDLDCGTVRLCKVRNLDEVVVNAETFTQSARMIMAIPSKSDISSSMNLIDLLNRMPLPGLNVNLFSQSATCYGKGIIYKVNGVPKSLEYVRTLNPERILKFEYQDNPTERYIGNPDIGGVINIVVKERSVGGSVYAYGSFCPWMPASFINGDVAFSYNFKNSQIELGYNNDTRDFNKVLYDFQRIYSDIASDYRMVEDFKSENSLMRYIDNRVSCAYTYSNPESDLLVQASLGVRLFKKHTTLNGWVTIDNASPYYRNQDVQDNTKSPSLDCYFRKGWKGSKSFEMNYVASLSHLDYRRSMQDHRDFEPYLLDNCVLNRFFGSVLEACYNMPIERINFSAGIKDSYGKAENKYSDSEPCKLEENSLNAYMSFFWQLGGFSLNLIESAIFNHVIDGNSANNYWRNTSALQFNIRVKRAWDINGYINYSPYSPTLSQLSTVKVENNEHIVTTGNPDLKPSHSVYSRFRTSWQHKNILSFVTITDSYTRNVIIPGYSYIGKGNFMNTYENFPSINSIEVSANVTVRQLFKHWDVRIFGGYLYSHARDDDFKHSMADWFVGGSVTFYTGPFTLYAFASTPRKHMSPYQVYESNPENGISILYNWRSFQFGFSLYSLYGKHKAWYSEQWDVNPFVSQHFLQRMPQSFWVGALRVTYKLNFGKSYKPIKKGLSNKPSDNSVLIVE